MNFGPPCGPSAAATTPLQPSRLAQGSVAVPSVLLEHLQLQLWLPPSLRHEVPEWAFKSGLLEGRGHSFIIHLQPPQLSAGFRRCLSWKVALGLPQLLGGVGKMLGSRNLKAAASKLTPSASPNQLVLPPLVPVPMPLSPALGRGALLTLACPPPSCAFLDHPGPTWGRLWSTGALKELL